MAFGAMGSFRPTVINGGRVAPPVTDLVIDLTAVETPIPPRPSVPKPVPLPAAVASFVTELQEWAAGNEFRLQHLVEGYEELRASRGWPVVSTKKLSQQLVHLGCKRTKLDLRASGKGRLVAMRLPAKRAA